MRLLLAAAAALALASSAVAVAAPRPSAARARDEARTILQERRFHGSTTPRPLHSVLEAIGRGIRWVFEKLAWPFRQLGLGSPGSGGWSDVVWGLIGALVVAAAAAAAVALGRRGGGLRIESGADGRTGRRAGEDPARLERSADEAERDGDLAGALRLRFRAGLIRLARARVIPARSSVTTREVRRAVASPEFDVLARDFDEVVYGHRAASAGDVERARAGWPRVLESVGER
jgi:hypothetical protein